MVDSESKLFCICSLHQSTLFRTPITFQSLVVVLATDPFLNCCRNHGGCLSSLKHADLDIITLLTDICFCAQSHATAINRLLPQLLMRRLVAGCPALQSTGQNRKRRTMRGRKSLKRRLLFRALLFSTGIERVPRNRLKLQVNAIKSSASFAH